MPDREQLKVYFNTEEDRELLAWLKASAANNGRSQSAHAVYLIRQARKLEEAAQKARRQAMSEIDWEIA